MPTARISSSRSASGRAASRARLRRSRGSVLGALAAVVLLAAACSDSMGPVDRRFSEVAVVVNSVGGTLSLVGRSGLDGRLVAENDVRELGPGANAVTLAFAEQSVAVPVGATDSLLVFEPPGFPSLFRRCAAALPAGGSPGGVAIARGDAYVSLLVSGQVARVDLQTCAIERIAPVGPGPADVEVLDGTVMVVVGNLDFSTGGIPPRLGESYVAFLDAGTLTLRDTIGTLGFNAQFAALDLDGDLLVVNSGDFGSGNSTITVIDPALHRVEAGPFPLGEFGVDVAVGPDNRAYITSFADGLYVFDAGANRLLRGRENPLFAPGPAGARRGSSGVAVDGDGNVLSVFFGDAATPGEVFLFNDEGVLVDSAEVGLGPVGARFGPPLLID
jgi:DNA-binding beta-propeller fold protein YncE